MSKRKSVDFDDLLELSSSKKMSKYEEKKSLKLKDFEWFFQFFAYLHHGATSERAKKIKNFSQFKEFVLIKKLASKGISYDYLKKASIDDLIKFNEILEKFGDEFIRGLLESGTTIQTIITSDIHESLSIQESLLEFTRDLGNISVNHEQNEIQRLALKLGASVEQSAQFTHMIQIRCLQDGIPVEEVLDSTIEEIEGFYEHRNEIQGGCNYHETTH